MTVSPTAWRAHGLAPHMCEREQPEPGAAAEQSEERQWVAAPPPAEFDPLCCVEGFAQEDSDDAGHDHEHSLMRSGVKLAAPLATVMNV